MINLRKFLAIDIGGKYLKYGIINQEGQLIEVSDTAIQVAKGGPIIVEEIKRIGDQYSNLHDLSGVCICTAGQVDSVQGKILYALPDIIPGYTGMLIKEKLENHFKLPVAVENDVNCVGLAESWLGNGKNAKSLYCLTIGPGIGGSYILDSQLLTGHSYSAGEIGYIPQFRSIAAKDNLIEKVAKQKGVDPAEFSDEMIFKEAKNGDEICINEINHLINNLSAGISKIIYMMNPEKILIGGEISDQRDYLYPRLLDQLKEDLVPRIFEAANIGFASHLNHAGMIGALKNFLIQEDLKPLNKIITIIESTRHKFTKNEHIIADYIISNLSDVPDLTISDMAKKIDVAPASLSRFCKKTGIETYNNLRIMTSKASVSKKKIVETSIGVKNPVQKTYEAMMESFDGIHALTNYTKVQNLITESKRIFLIGTVDIEKSLVLLKNRLMSNGYDVQLFITPEEISLSENIINSSILVVAFSIYGYDNKIVEYVAGLNNSITTIGITSQSDSPLSRTVQTVVIPPLVEEKANVFAKEFTLNYFIDLLLEDFE